MEELISKVWSNPKLLPSMRASELSWLRKELGIAGEETTSLADAKRLMQIAAILSCSDEPDHRRAAYRLATSAYELHGSKESPLDQALRVVLSRLGNFAAFGTRPDVDTALSKMPLSVAAEEIESSNERRIEVRGTEYFLTDFQTKLWRELTAKRRVALCAPTSAGKSFVLQSYLISLYSSDGPLSVVYLVPSRALITQVAEDLAAQFAVIAENRPEILTVPVEPDIKLPDRCVFVMTQERTLLSLNGHPEFKADLLIVDEAHSISEGSRGVLLQWVIDDLIEREPSLQVLFASPLIRNLEVFGRLFGLKDIIEFPSAEPTVAQNFLLVAVETATDGNISIHSVGDGSQVPELVGNRQLGVLLASRIDRLVHIAKHLGEGQSNIVYANGAAEAEKIALQLADLLSDRKATPAQIALSLLAAEAVHPHFALVECIKKGVAFHYSNIPTQLRRAIEQAVATGEVDFLVCTSTLLQGVNLPTRNIFMLAPEKGRLKPLQSTDFWNLAGRAGRLRKEFQGNIFLIDYDIWKEKPLSGEKDSVIVPAIEATIGKQEPELVDVMSGENGQFSSTGTDLETIFVRLFTDLKRGDLDLTLARAGVETGSDTADRLTQALTVAEGKVSLPGSVLRKSPNISAHKQQALFDELLAVMKAGPEAVKALIPRHPRESDAFDSYASLLEICHRTILGIDTTKKLHRFHALLATWWMKGMSLPQIIDQQIRQNKTASMATTIRSTLELIETQIRFQTVRLLGCYNVLLVYALERVGRQDLVASIPSLALYLEVGASDRTMISFMSLGLSRVAAMKLNDLAARKDMDAATALLWLRNRQLDALGLSPLLLAEVRLAIS